MTSFFPFYLSNFTEASITFVVQLDAVLLPNQSATLLIMVKLLGFFPVLQLFEITVHYLSTS